MTTTAFTGVSHICPRCGFIVDPQPGNPAEIIGTTLQYSHPDPCPAARARAWNDAGAGLQVILGSKGRKASA